MSNSFTASTRVGLHTNASLGYTMPKSARCILIKDNRGPHSHSFCETSKRPAAGLDHELLQIEQHPGKLQSISNSLLYHSICFRTSQQETVSQSFAVWWRIPPARMHRCRSN